MDNSPFPANSLIAAYLRDSGGDRQELSIEKQERSIREWCAQNQVELGRVFIDQARSGTTTIGRQAFQEMIAYFEGQPRPIEKGIVVWHFSRLAREFDDAQFYKSSLRRAGYIVHSINDPIPDTLEGRLIEVINDYANAKTSETMGVMISNGLADLVREHHGVPGTPPRGFKRRQIVINKHRDGQPRFISIWEPDLSMTDRIRTAFAMRANGASYGELDEIVRLYKSLTGYNHFFANRLYTGDLVYGDVVIENYCDPIVDRMTWDAVQARVRDNTEMWKDKNAFSHPRRKASSYLLSGMAHCALCGGRMSGLTIQTKKGQINTYYKCDHSRGLYRPRCAARQIPQETMERSVVGDLLGYLRERLSDEDIIMASPDQDDELRTAQGSLRAEIGARKATVERLVSAIADSGHSPALIDRLRNEEAALRRLNDQIYQIERQLNLSKRLTLDDIRGVWKKMEEFLLEGNLDQRRRVIQHLVQDIKVKLEDGVISGEITYHQFPDVELDERGEFIMRTSLSHQSRSSYTHNISTNLPPAKGRKAYTAHP